MYAGHYSTSIMYITNDKVLFLCLLQSSNIGMLWLKFSIFQKIQNKSLIKISLI